MTLRSCVECGELSDKPRCEQHRRPTYKPGAAARGYGWQWTRLSARARRIQPWCTDCGTTDDLQADHTPEAWARHAAGKPIRLADIDVVCGPCNRARGAARGPSATRGGGPDESPPRPRGKAEFESEIP